MNRLPAEPGTTETGTPEHRGDFRDRESAGGPDGPGLGSREFLLLRDLIRRETGIWLSDGKESLVRTRLAPRLRALRLRSFRDYCRLLADGGDAGERRRLYDCIVTPETRFFRELSPFRFLEERLVPQWKSSVAQRRRARRVRAWSAGCATGEEAYSLAMFLTDHLPPAAGWRVDVLATDLSPRVLARAREAAWPVERAQEIPAPYRGAFLLRGVRTQSGWMRLRPEIREICRFRELNLNDPVYPQIGTFDLIFCRNVLIYFGLEEKKQVLEKLLRHLEPGAYLFLGNAENPNGLTQRLGSIAPSAYTPSSARTTGQATSGPA